jgi:hypothetical protein
VRLDVGFFGVFGSFDALLGVRQQSSSALVFCAAMRTPVVANVYGESVVIPLLKQAMLNVIGRCHQVWIKAAGLSCLA